MIYIREMTVDDIEDVVFMWKKLIDHHKGLYGEYEINNNWYKLKTQELILDISRNNSKIFISNVFNSNIGYISLEVKEMSLLYNNKKIGNINEIFVNNEFRNSGIGRRLIEKALNWFEDNNIKEVWINVNPNNIDGLNFWDSMGFKTVGVRKNLLLFNLM